MTFPIEIVDDLVDDAGSKLYGKICFVPRDKIQLWRGQSRVRMKESLLHECLHALDEKADLKLRERQVASMSRALFEWMRDNREIVKWMLNMEALS